MSPLSPRLVALPAAALAIIIGLAQANSQVPDPAESQAPEISVHRVTSCAAATNILAVTCAVAHGPHTTVTR